MNNGTKAITNQTSNRFKKYLLVYRVSWVVILSTCTLSIILALSLSMSKLNSNLLTNKIERTQREIQVGIKDVNLLSVDINEKEEAIGVLEEKINRYQPLIIPDSMLNR